MKINEIITEAVENDALKLARKIVKNCQPYLSQINYDPIAFTMLRGMGNSVETGYRLRHRSNRKPRDTQQEYSEWIDDWFNAKFGVRYRSAGTFATGKISDAEMYGVAYRVFPIGEFSFCWSPKVSDITMKLTKYELDTESGNIVDYEAIIDGLENADYQTTNLQDAIKSEHEIMLYCPNGYFLLNAKNDLELLALQYIHQAREKTTLPRNAKQDMVNNARGQIVKLTGELELIDQLFKQAGYTFATYDEFLALDDESIEEINWNLADLIGNNRHLLSLGSKTIYRSAAVSILRQHQKQVIVRIEQLHNFLKPYENT